MSLYPVLGHTIVKHSGYEMKLGATKPHIGCQKCNVTLHSDTKDDTG